MYEVNQAVYNHPFNCVVPGIDQGIDSSLRLFKSTSGYFQKCINSLHKKTANETVNLSW